MYNEPLNHAVLPELDENGYIVDTNKWTKEVAEILARSDIPQGLTDDHWKVIDFLRQYFLEWECVPPVRMIARQTGLSLRDLKGLFPDGLAKYACRYAGLPYRVLTRYP
jgi:TusE/DsrC/DsvC family sulfur relay protein